MTIARSAAATDAFFLKADTGDRFCLFHPPASARKAKGTFIYVHPFCDEMNTARRMAALQSRALAELGYGVLQMDLFGCGDSSGDFADARWDIWKSDLALAHQWIEDHLPSPVALWGLRLGAMLAVDYVNDAVRPITRMMLWHPVINGKTYLAQFWRMKLASQMLSGEETPSQTKAIRDSLAEGRHIEVAGYALAPEMVGAIEKLRLGNLSSKGTRIDWFDLAPKADAPLPPAIARTVDAWKDGNVDLHLHLLPGTAFWSSPEIGMSQALLDATTTLFAEVPV